ncbi:50S ribosomal protein L13 [Candidatus Woesebacteria bacterium]|nr:50S ribosomal protein L13 [Candidatus Woesebacteria bacterium]|tara:strand:+ start:98 stop:526 length:429 start_codon:yes stop_codon:yes gene_type:complete
MLFRTHQPKASEIKRSWHFVDVKGEILGRVATKIAQLLIGKHKRTYVPHLDSGDYVVVVNAKDIRVTGRKEQQKTYYRHSGYPGALKARTFVQMKEKNPGKIIELAVRNMLPKNRLRSQRMGRLKVFAGSEHSYSDKLKGDI